MKNLIAAAALAAVSAVTGTAASAAYISFSQDRGWTTGGLSFGNGSENVTVSSGVVGAQGMITAGGNIRSYAGHGLAICSGALGNGCSGDAHYIDGNGAMEAAVLDFGNLIVQFQRIQFTHVDNDDTFSLGVYGNGLATAPTDSLVNKGLPNGSWSTWSSLLSVQAGSVFGIAALNGTDDFKIRKIKFKVLGEQAAPPPSAVPLPAGGVLLLSGFGVAALMRRRKKA